MEDFKLDKIGCNHLIIAGLLESKNYAKADFLSMHLEQHLKFTIDRQGKLKSQWDDYYQKVLVPLEITSPEIEQGETVVFTREGRLIGSFEDYQKWAKLKYNIEIEYDDDRMDAISKVQVEQADNQIADNNTEEFDAKVDSLLKSREEYLNKMSAVLDTHNMICNTVNSTIDELNEYVKAIQPHVDALYALHHYPVKEETPEEEEKEEHEEEKAEKEENGENEGENGENENETENETETETENETSETNEEKPQADEEQQQNTEETEENAEEKENAEANEEPEKQPTEEEEKEEAPKEEEESAEPDPEALEVQAKMQEHFKFPELPKFQEAVGKLNDSDLGLQEFIDQIKANENECTELIKAEKFKWKKLEKAMLDLKDKIAITINMLKISILSAEDLQIKAVQAEIDNYENFLIPNQDEEVLHAAAIKFAATFDFA